MNDPNINSVIKSLLSLIKDKKIDSSPPKELLDIEGFAFLYNAIFELRNAITAFSGGELDYRITERGYLPSIVKALQASMKHLVWYTKAVSLGDFSQRIDFMGELADAFNQMANKLESNFNEISKLESEAREAKEHFEQIFSTSPETTVISRLSDGLIVDVNEAFYEVFGYERKESIGKSTQELNVYEDYEDRKRLINEIKTKGYCKNLEVIFRKKSGERIICLMSAKLIKLQGILHLIIVARDITMVAKLESEVSEAKEHFEEIFNTSPEATLISRLSDGLIVNVNQAFCDVFGYKKDEAVGKYAQDIKMYENYSHRQKILDEIKTKGACKNLKIILRKKSCEQIVALISAKAIKLKGTMHLIFVVRDITITAKLEEALNKSEKKYRILFENATEMITVFQNGKIKICNPIAEEITGYCRGELISRPGIYFVHPDDRERMIIDQRRRLKGEVFDNNISIFRILKKDNTIRWIEMKSIKIEWENEDATLNLLSDITERKLAEEEIQYLSYHDQLTGLYNRRFYEKEIEKLNYEKKYYPLSIIMADVNGLKLTNDAFGHIAGDILLTSIAKILKRECRKNDIIARIGGDEFVILMANTDAKSANGIINCIDKAITNENIENVVLSLSMGLAVKIDAFDDVNEVFKKAEDDMYKHKLSKSETMKRRTIERVVDKLYENNIEMLHSKNVSRICEAIAAELDLTSEEIRKIKIAVDVNVFNKSEKLSSEEWAVVKRHPEIGYRILNSVDEFADIGRFVLEHHEKWNGSGYPKGLKENEISLQGRIIAIANTFDLMTSERPYKKTLTVEEAVNEIRKNAGIKFDPFIVKIFIDNVLGR
jgi:diguanylate cyclase (GGDEF)-like protein/PAS domain S-box-containing protein